MAKRNNTARDEQGVWDIGGGKIEFGEAAEATLQREIREEYCTDALDAEFLGYRDVIREETHWLALDFMVLLDRAKVCNGEPDKFDDLAWFTLEGLPENIHSQGPVFFEKYQDQLEVFK